MTRDLSSPLLRSLGAQSLPGYLRFGGSGNDGLRYALDMPDPGSPGNRCSPPAAGAPPEARRCLNRTWVDNLCGFANSSKAKLVWGALPRPPFLSPNAARLLPTAASVQ